jgi:hypothetical protein
MRRALQIVCAACILLGWQRLALADALVLVVNPASGVQSLTKEQAVNLFMGRYRKLPSGITAIPVDISGESAERKRFYHLLLQKDLADINAYWARLIFSGQASPPLQAPDARTALDLVATNRSAVAYVERKLIDNRVKVVLELEP